MVRVRKIPGAMPILNQRALSKVEKNPKNPSSVLKR